MNADSHADPDGRADQGAVEPAEGRRPSQVELADVSLWVGATATGIVAGLATGVLPLVGAGCFMASAYLARTGESTGQTGR